MVDQRRVLSSYRADSTAFRIHPGPGERCSDEQRSLQGYLHRQLPAAGFEPRAAGDAVDAEAARPLLDSDLRGFNP
jgi:hypothetical protein